MCCVGLSCSCIGFPLGKNSGALEAIQSGIWEYPDLRLQYLISVLIVMLALSLGRFMWSVNAEGLEVLGSL